MLRDKNFILFVALPVCANLILMGMYFSGNQYAQYLVAPQFDWLHHRSWREFGLLEQMQNAFLLTIVFLFAAEAIKRPSLLEKVFFLCGSMVMLLLLLEELDYGIHFYEYFNGQESTIEVKQRNWHNRDISGRSINGRLKKISSLLMIIWFVICPVLSSKVNFKVLSSIIPSQWFVVAFTVVILFSSLAHYLDNLGLASINGVAGGLEGNISEFRETSTYYLYLLYAVQLITTKNLFSSSVRKT